MSFLNKISGKELSDEINQFSEVYGQVLLGMHTEVTSIAKQIENLKIALKEVDRKSPVILKDGSTINVVQELEPKIQERLNKAATSTTFSAAKVEEVATNLKNTTESLGQILLLASQAHQNAIAFTTQQSKTQNEALTLNAQSLQNSLQQKLDTEFYNLKSKTEAILQSTCSALEKSYVVVGELHTRQSEDRLEQFDLLQKQKVIIEDIEILKNRLTKGFPDNYIQTLEQVDYGLDSVVKKITENSNQATQYFRQISHLTAETAQEINSNAEKNLAKTNENFQNLNKDIIKEQGELRYHIDSYLKTIEKTFTEKLEHLEQQTLNSLVDSNQKIENLNTFLVQHEEQNVLFRKQCTYSIIGVSALLLLNIIIQLFQIRL